jgi:hypothetical protein
VTEAVHYAKLASGWDLLLAGLQVDEAQLAEDVARAAAEVRKDWP